MRGGFAYILQYAARLNGGRQDFTGFESKIRHTAIGRDSDIFRKDTARFGEMHREMDIFYAPWRDFSALSYIRQVAGFGNVWLDVGRFA